MRAFSVGRPFYEDVDDALCAVAEAGAEFDVVERDVPEPAPNGVRIAVDARGICHSDALVNEGTYPGVSDLWIS